MSGERLLALFAADGAGSALRGGQGAEIAMQAIAEVVAGLIPQREFGLTDELAVECVRAVRQRLAQEAERDGLVIRDFACTLLGLLSTDKACLALQIGDGGIVLDAGAGLELAIVPMSGEYANMTYFVTDEGAIKQLKTRFFESPVSRAALFTDGLQRLALNMVCNQPHGPFFEPFFRVLSTTSEDKEVELEHALVRFLDSEQVCDRTDDDKTLVLACRI